MTRRLCSLILVSLLFSSKAWKATVFWTVGWQIKGKGWIANWNGLMTLMQRTRAHCTIYKHCFHSSAREILVTRYNYNHLKLNIGTASELVVTQQCFTYRWCSQEVTNSKLWTLLFTMTGQDKYIVPPTTTAAGRRINLDTATASMQSGTLLSFWIRPHYPQLLLDQVSFLRINYVS